MHVLTYDFRLAVEWNRLLFTSLIPRAWLAFLESVAASTSPENLYRLLPPVQNHSTSGDAAYWSPLLHHVVQLALDCHSAIWPVVSPADAVHPVFTVLDDTLIASTQDDPQHIDALAKAGVWIIRPPSDLYSVLVQLRPAHVLSPATAQMKLKVSSLVQLQISEFI